VSDPLRLTVDVACSTDHAFRVWTAEIARWWPADHTVSGADDSTVVLEGRVGGRIYERTADGAEHDWGEVTVWDPPARLGYSWFLRTDRADATDVEIRFVPGADGGTRVEIEHAGWERLGERGPAWRERNLGGWSTLFPYFRSAVAGP
jgi:uncharacterized protein YndB with AHSA1/START domain